ncbi:MAG: hypothetical protein LBQ44_05420, partial [Treponema sp.]|nr:hypothetical protein [Treponema sp.]
ISVMDAETRTAWGIPTDKFTALGVAYSEAKVLLDKATSSERTATITAECQAAFKAMTETMKDFKRRYFLIPPLTEASLISLGLKPRDPPTPSGKPTAQVTLESSLVGRHELGVKIVYITGNPDDKANKGYRIWYSVVASGETPPADPEELRKSFFTKRKKDRMEFDFGDSGKTVYFAVQVENDGKKGPWGPLVNALIP